MQSQRSRVRRPRNTIRERMADRDEMIHAQCPGVAEFIRQHDCQSTRWSVRWLPDSWTSGALAPSPGLIANSQARHEFLPPLPLMLPLCLGKHVEYVLCFRRSQDRAISIDLDPNRRVDGRTSTRYRLQQVHGDKVRVDCGCYVRLRWLGYVRQSFK